MALDFNRLKIYFVPLLFIIGSILTGLMLIFPTVEQTLVVRSETAILEEKRAKLSAKAQVLEGVNENGLKGDLAAAEISLPTDKSVSGIIFGLETLAASAGATLTGFSTEVGKISTPAARLATESAVTETEELVLPYEVKNIKVEAQILGDYDSIQNFLTQINKVNRLIGLDSVKFDKDTGKIVLLVFYQPRASNLGAVESPVEDITAAERNFLRQAAQYTLATPELENLPTGKVNPFQ